MSETTPPAAPVSPTKSILASKTLWLQIIMIALGFFPPALAWLKANPVDALVAIGALNVLVRFATSGKVSLFPGLSESATADPGQGDSGGGSGWPMPLLVTCATAGLMGFCLPSCSGYPLTGSVAYRDPQTGAKAGLEFKPGQAPAAVLKVQLYDPRTGQPLGVVDLRSGK